MLENIHIINPTDFKDEEEKEALFEYLSSRPDIDFVKRNDPISTSKGSFVLSHNLIIDRETKGRYFVIAAPKEEDSVLGEGTYSKYRNIKGVVVLDEDNKTINFTQMEGKGVRISNPKKAQADYAKDLAETDPNDTERLAKLKERAHSHDKAMHEYEKLSIATHLGLQEPVHVTRTKHGIFSSKDYMIVNKLPGIKLGKSVDSYFDQEPRTSIDMLDNFIIAIIEAYKKQLFDKGIVHRDISHANVLSNLHEKRNGPPQYNFIDFDEYKKPNTPDNFLVGTPGFMAPEVTKKDEIGLVTVGRDTFSLSLLIMSCLNQNIHPNDFLADNRNASTKEAQVDALTALVEQYGCYDPDALLEEIDPGGAGHSLFMDFADKDYDELTQGNPAKVAALEAAQKSIVQILKDMSKRNPAERRQDVDNILSELKTISRDLKEKLGINLAPEPEPQTIKRTPSA